MHDSPLFLLSTIILFLSIVSNFLLYPSVVRNGKRSVKKKTGRNEERGLEDYDVFYWSLVYQ